MAEIYPSFGRTVRAGTHALTLGAALDELRQGSTSLLPYGNGRTYGDSCQNADGALVDMSGHASILDFDAQTGVLEAESGVMLGDIIAHGRPHGWFPPVLPGTQFVTLGGAIANDVHGKNHHRRGSFGAHVLSFDLARSGGEMLHCSPTENAHLFAATIGGMGLTGIILSARIQLMQVASVDIEEQVKPFPSLGHYFDMAEDGDIENEYAVAWLDQMATGARAGRGVLLLGNHSARDASPAGVGRRPLTVPFQPPLTILNKPFLTLFNLAYRAAKMRRKEISLTPYQSYFFPLDAVSNWNRLYGPAGLFQHQSVIPEPVAREIVPALLSASHAAGQGSFLTVLKRFGTAGSPGIISFPRPGYTLTLDFPNRGAATLALLERLDAITMEAGGAVNPYKDARMSAAVFKASFPRWQELEVWRDARFVSDFWKRTVLRVSGSA
ncbi:FAD-binding oxidoreductase [Limoniibacter endophyticus]|uniref:FAD-linked oxidase n=1 Tax=Limoniibacter endophyticus TaxID=1565040 RepID=A0A8J3DK33_9HYPH|nr:FAD-binding oxidoreductase [Limoniibacter endophyticus]GHC75459.1 FAD-linked oxidase [Limoniibacter endophyticus]